jgi:LysM repeat protein
LVRADRATSPSRVARRGVGRPAGRGWKSAGVIAVLGGLTLSGLADATHTVAAGDTLWALAKHYATTPQAIVAANHLQDPNLIPVGASLLIPGAPPAGAPAPAAAPPAGAPAPAGARAAAPVWVTHTVVAGENLTGIAAKYGVGLPALVAQNAIADPDVITIGSVLKVKEAVAVPQPPSPAPPVQPLPPPPPPMTAHTVVAGETLTGIAASYKVTVASLMALNKLANPDLLRIGETVIVPVPPPGSVAALLVHYAQVFGVDPALVEGLAWQESGWQQQVVSGVGAVGVMQLMPGTAAFTGTYLLQQAVDPANVGDNVQAGVAFLAYLIRQAGGNQALAVAGYYQGLTSVLAKGMYTDTRRYVANVTALRQHFSR